MLLTVGAALGQSNSPVPPVCPEGLSDNYKFYHATSGWECGSVDADCDPGDPSVFSVIHNILAEAMRNGSLDDLYNCSNKYLPPVLKNPDTCINLDETGWTTGSIDGMTCEPSPGSSRLRGYLAPKDNINDCLNIFKWAFNICNITDKVKNPSNSHGEVVAEVHLNL